MRIRFLKFTAVGAAGFVLQLTALWILVHRFDVHYVIAGLAATELAILLNFLCHELWTWSDRAGNPVLRLIRFHIANGAISLAGAALMMPLLVDMAGIHYMLANVLTICGCAVANFLAADRFVFTGIQLKHGPTYLATFLLMTALASLGAPLEAAELRGDTLEAFDRYVRVTESRMNGELQGKAPFLWVDRLADAPRREAVARLKQGETVVKRLVTRERSREIEAPHGLIHHWVGTTFAPRVTADRVVALMQGYDRYQQVYSPNVRTSRAVGQPGGTYKVQLQLFMKKVIGVVLNTEYDVRYTRIDPRRVHVRSYSTRIAEVQNPGEADEKEAPVGQDNGFLWRFYNYCSIEERSEGSYIQCESISLSRAIPTGFGWLVGPFVTSIPRESLEFTLGAMRKTLSYSGT
jgi:putative flippase GtrA